MTWLIDTLLWTGALIMIVLLARRPVARHFGAHAAYALWALPLVRMAFPPIELPAWLAPVSVPATATYGYEATISVVSEPTSIAPVIDVNWTMILIAIWLGGAAVFAVNRLAAYARLRRELLASARRVGQSEGVVFVETPATASPLAFGVLHRFVALPPGFMAQHDRLSRDLALTHELEHHRARDLLANFAALPLFALHWFNPLARLGWHAMRRDQEAACDARVVAKRDRRERATYAALIAGVAAAPHAALVAPMACPVLGDKSIIHRLRTLSMTDPSDRRRRSGLLLVGVAALALPLTATISYAHDNMQLPQPPLAPEVPLPPDAPVTPEAPMPPAPPSAPEASAMGASRIVIEEESPDGTRRERRVMTFRSGEGNPHLVVRTGDGRTIAPDSPEFEAHMKKIERDMERAAQRMERTVRFEESRAKRLAEHAAAASDIAAANAEVARARAEAAGAVAEAAGARAEAMAPRVVESCDGNGSVSQSVVAGGKRVIRICQNGARKHAIAGLKAARSSISQIGQFDPSTRAQVVADIDRQIARLEASE